MEPVSLAIGIAGLYNASIDILDRVRDYRDFGRESSTTIARFDASKLRLQHWARDVGIGNDGLTDPHDVRLDDPQTASVVRENLYWSGKLFQKVEYNTTSLKLPVRQRLDSEQWSLPSPDGGADTEYRQKFSKKGRLAWSMGSKTKLTQDVEQFEKLVETLHSIVPSRDERRDGLANSSHLEQKLDLLADVGLERLLEVVTTERQRSLDEWLDATKDDDQYDRFLAACLDGTCEWILRHPSYLAWEKRDEKEKVAKLLWIHGPAGFGKTILSATLIRHIREKLRLPLAYCFSSSHAQTAKELSGVIRTWLTQLVRLDRGAFEVAYTFLQERNTRRASKEDAWTLMNKLTLQIQGCVFVLDGLDEFPSVDDQRRVFLSRLKNCLQSTTTSALITSRSEFDINFELRRPVPKIDKYRFLECKISEDTVKPDIDIFASSIVERRLPRQGESLRKELSARMAERCHGQFLWLKLQQSQLRDSRSPKILRESIEVMPQGLHSTYEHSWNSIQALEEPDLSRAVDTLRWLTFALQPITVQMLAEAMVVNLERDSEGFSEDDLPDVIDDVYIDGEIRQLCGSLVEVEGHEDPRWRVVRLVHASVSEFLAIKLPPPFVKLAPTRSTLSSAQHSILAACCIGFLDSAKTWMPGSGRRGPSFRTYAANAWFRHLKESRAYYDDISDCVDPFMKPGNENFERWKMEVKDSAPTSFYYAAKFGLVPTMIALYDNERVDINSTGGHFGTALQAVCARGDTEAFDQLMHWQADPTIRAGYYGSALNAAAYRGNINMVERLLDSALSARSITELHEAMRLAAGGGSNEVVKLLLDRGAPVDPPEALYPIHQYFIERIGETTPLMAAARTSQIETLRLLLGRGANPNLSSLPDQRGWTALHSAATVNSHEAVELLLLHGAIVDANGPFGTPLHIAARHRAIDIVQILLKNGATIDAYDERKCTPLHGAAGHGNIDIIKALLDNGATIDACDEEQCTPLYDAAGGGNIDTLAYLLHKGANPNAQNTRLRTPLHIASRIGNIDIVKALLENGALIDAKDDVQSTPLHLAAENGRIDVLLHLLHKGANPNALCAKFGTPLHIASRIAGIDIVKALLENGALIDAKDAVQSTPLHLAAETRRIDVLLHLLYKGANPNALCAKFGTPLHIASKIGDINMIKALLENGALIDAKDDVQSTPLYLAAEKGRGATPLISAISNDHSEIAMLLIDHGADVNFPGKDGETALKLALRTFDDEFVRHLIQSGADLGSMDHYGMTCSNWLRRARPHLMMPEVEGYEPDKTSSGPDRSVLKNHLLHHAKDMWSDEARTTIWIWVYFMARCFLLLEMEDQAMRAYNFESSNVFCDGCGMHLRGKVAFFACKFCPDIDICEDCMEGHSKGARRKLCLSHKFMKIMPLEASSRAVYDNEAFRKWLDEIIEQFTD